MGGSFVTPCLCPTSPAPNLDCPLSLAYSCPILSSFLKTHLSMFSQALAPRKLTCASMAPGLYLVFKPHRCLVLWNPLNTMPPHHLFSLVLLCNFFSCLPFPLFSSPTSHLYFYIPSAKDNLWLIQFKGPKWFLSQFRNSQVKLSENFQSIFAFQDIKYTKGWKTFLRFFFFLNKISII